MNKMDIKKEILKSLIEAMDSRMTDGLKNKSPKFQKVEVIAPNEEKLEDGLEHAKEMIGSQDEEPVPEHSDEEQSPEMSSEDADDIERLKELWNKLK